MDGLSLSGRLERSTAQQMREQSLTALRFYFPQCSDELLQRKLAEFGGDMQATFEFLSNEEFAQKEREVLRKNAEVERVF